MPCDRRPDKQTYFHFTQSKHRHDTCGPFRFRLQSSGAFSYSTTIRIFDWIFAGAVENFEMCRSLYGRRRSSYTISTEINPIYYGMASSYTRRMRNERIIIWMENREWCYVSLLFALQRKQFWCENKRHRLSGNARVRTKMVGANREIEWTKKKKNRRSESNRGDAPWKTK